MNILEELESQYNENETDYSNKEFLATKSKRKRKEIYFQIKRKLNDEVYFLYMFTRLEALINEKSNKLIKKKFNSRLTWKQKVPWDYLAKQDKDDRLYFKEKLKLLAEKGKKDFNQTSMYYDERCSLAHGGNFIRSINMPKVISDFKRLYKVFHSK